VFTGIVEGIGTIVRWEERAGIVALEVEAGALEGSAAVGDSVALDGCCLTVTRAAVSRLHFEAVPETLRRTALGERRAGSRVNLERALRADGRLGGHFVQGHVDGKGRVERIDRQDCDVRMRLSCEFELARQIVPKGSIAIDGVSLTVVDPDGDGFAAALIPHTLAATTLGDRIPGDWVNLEVDLLGKYVRAYLERYVEPREIPRRPRG
jgi:riboflavin synthase